MVVIDTEEEFDWSRPHSRENTAVTSPATQTAAQSIFETKGLVPTYVVDYPVAISDLAREIMRPWAAAGRCIIGAHLHPWVNPPFEEAISAYNTYPGNLSVSGEIRGRDAIIEWFTLFLDQFPKINIALKHVCIENLFDLSGTNVISAEYDNTVINKDGQSFVYRGVSVITIKKGKTLSVRDYIFDLNDDFRSAWGEG